MDAGTIRLLVAKKIDWSGVWSLDGAAKAFAN